MRKKMRRIRPICLLLALLLLMCGCTYSSERPPGMTTSRTERPTEAETTEKPYKKRVALTFDDGPHPERTRQIVDELAIYGFHATFFVVGNRIDGTEMNCSKTLRYTLEQGHEVGIHGYTHNIYYNDCTEDEYLYELNQTAAAILDVAPDYKILYMRPIGGRISDVRVDESEYSIIQWDVDSEDWRHRYSRGDSDEVCAEKVSITVENIMSGVSDGSIILMHDIYESTYDAVKIVLQRLHEEGYEVVTVGELLGEDRQSGREYYRRAD